jgi:hypothetical protein
VSSRQSHWRLAAMMAQDNDLGEVADPVVHDLESRST